MSKQLWFVNKTYGYGWTPATWQGWLVVAVYIGVVGTSALLLTQSAKANPEESPSFLPAYFATLALATTILLIITYRKGEKPRWNWGSKSK